MGLGYPAGNHSENNEVSPRRTETGEIRDPEASRYFLETLIERQHKTARYYMCRLNPIGEFEVAAGGLRFVNLPERYGFAGPGTTYRSQWSVFDNRDGSTREFGGVAEATQASVPLPDEAADVTDGGERYLLAEVSCTMSIPDGTGECASSSVRRECLVMVGVERESDPPDASM